MVCAGRKLMLLTLNTAAVVMLLLVMAGDVEQNPGPGKINNRQKKDKSQPPTGSSDTEGDKTVDDVFRSHFSLLVKAITEPKFLAVDLFSKGFISETLKNRITTITGVDTTEKAIMLMNEVEARLKVDPRPAQVMRDFCAVLETEPALRPVVESIKTELRETEEECSRPMEDVDGDGKGLAQGGGGEGGRPSTEARRGVVAVTGEDDRSLMEDVDGDREPQPQKQEGRGLSTEHGGSVSGCPLQTAAPAAWHDLIQIKPWDGFGKRSIAESIALHSPVLCDNFANLLLKDHLLVKSLRRNNPGNDSLPFVQAVLEKWFYKSGSAVPCTWESLLECMKDAGLDEYMIQLIRKHML